MVELDDGTEEDMEVLCQYDRRNKWFRSLLRGTLAGLIILCHMKVIFIHYNHYLSFGYVI